MVKRNSKQKASAKDNKNIAAMATTTTKRTVKRPKTTDDMTTWEIFTQHPLIYVGKFIIIPYILYLSYYFIPLQHPEYITKLSLGLINLRPVVHGSDTPRQVLILASQSSGTVQMTEELNNLGIEIGHETVDAAWSFVRDGTISWFHGIRFLTEPNTKEEMLTSITGICNDDFLNNMFNMGFHPAEYGPPRGKCSYRSKWNTCWRNECYRILLNEWGCSIKDNCDMRFAYNIHQVRNPMRTIESLVVKFCIGGVEGEVQPALLNYAGALFPFHNFSRDSCIEASGYFLLYYTEAMIEARKRGEISGFYRIEETSACQVAKMAGLASLNTTVYEPNYHKVQKICNVEGDVNHPAQQVVKKKLNKVNLDQVHLGWKDLQGGMHGSKKKKGDTHLEKRVRSLFVSLGYDESKELDIGIVLPSPSLSTEL